MLFSIENLSNSKLSIYRAKHRARQFVILWKKGATEKELDQYLFTNYKVDLVHLCLRIINKATYNLNYRGEIVITILDKKLDELASIITFGTGKISGSNILRYAFGQL